MVFEGYDSEEVKKGFRGMDYHKPGEQPLVETAMMGERLEKKMKKISETLEGKNDSLNKKEEELIALENDLNQTTKDLYGIENLTEEELVEIKKKYPELIVSDQEKISIRNVKKALEKKVKRRKAVIDTLKKAIRLIKEKTFQ